MVNPSENTSLADLFGGLVSDLSGLVRKEIDLAKTEAGEKYAKALVGVEVLVVGVILAIAAVGVLLGALVSALASVFVKYGMALSTANALAAFLVGAIMSVIAWVMLSKGLASLRGTNLKLDRSTASLRRDVDAVKEKM
jgi:hypothetical protein